MALLRCGRIPVLRAPKCVFGRLNASRLPLSRERKRRTPSIESSEGGPGAARWRQLHCGGPSVASVPERTHPTSSAVAKITTKKAPTIAPPTTRRSSECRSPASHLGACATIHRSGRSTSTGSRNDSSGRPPISTTAVTRPQARTTRTGMGAVVYLRPTQLNPPDVVEVISFGRRNRPMTAPNRSLGRALRLHAARRPSQSRRRRTHSVRTSRHAGRSPNVHRR